MWAVRHDQSRRPSTGRWQIVLIEDADRLTEGAANALLKVVEEPPPSTVFLLCAPSVGPGYDARRGSGDVFVKQRRNGATYDSMWRMAIAAHADRVTITSYNEWHEGTQIEPASWRPTWRGRYRYLSYNGAWGLQASAAAHAYLTRTRYWSSVFRSTSPVQLKISAS